MSDIEDVSEHRLQTRGCTGCQPGSCGGGCSSCVSPSCGRSGPNASGGHDIPFALPPEKRRRRKKAEGPTEDQIHRAVVEHLRRRAKPTLRERFEAKTIPEPNSGCLIWTGAARRAGYGRIKSDDNKVLEATHVAMQLAGKEVPPGKQVLHTCDNPSCVNHEHLFIGDAAANAADAIKKGRHNFAGLEFGRGRARKEEQQIHRAVVKHLELRGVPGMIFWHTPNGAYYGDNKRRAIHGGMMKALGLRPGVPDLILIHNSNVYALELKSETGRPTVEQMAFMSDFNAAGGHGVICHDLDRALRVLECWGLLKGTAGA